MPRWIVWAGSTLVLVVLVGVSSLLWLSGEDEVEVTVDGVQPAICTQSIQHMVCGDPVIAAHSESGSVVEYRFPEGTPVYVNGQVDDLTILTPGMTVVLSITRHDERVTSARVIG